MERVYRDGNDSYILKMIALSAHSGEKQAVYLNQRTQQLLVEPLAEFMNRVAAPANQQFGTAEKIALIVVALMDVKMFMLNDITIRKHNEMCIVRQQLFLMVALTKMIICR